MIDIILFCLAVLVLHELGHYLAYMFIYPIKPFIKVTWYGIVTDTKESYRLKIKNVIFIASLGIWLGLVPFVIFQTPNEWILIYFLTCCIDITLIVSYLGEDLNMTIIDFARKQVKDLESNISKGE
jgi:hypothetical protein